MGKSHQVSHTASNVLVLALAGSMTTLGFFGASALAQTRTAYCESYAHEYARRNSAGKVVGGGVRGAVGGAVVGGIADGNRGARRGARIGGTVGAIAGGANRVNSYSILYDEAFRRCLRR